VDVVRDLLDKQVVDRNGREMGRVDGVAFEQRSGEAPRLAELLIGPSVLGDRLHPAVARFISAFESAALSGVARPVRIAAGDIGEIEGQVRIDRPIGETGADIVERLVRTWITRIPGA
jgi:sporulation protein YlmC with PRC-barrel domain